MNGQVLRRFQIKVIKDDNKSLNDFIDFIKQNGYKVLN